MVDNARIQRNSNAKWTFLVYMAGDNNLDGAALRDIAEMARAGSTKDVNILVQLDRIEDKLTRRFRITQGGGFKKDCFETFSESNTGDPLMGSLSFKIVKLNNQHKSGHPCHPHKPGGPYKQIGESIRLTFAIVIFTIYFLYY